MNNLSTPTTAAGVVAPDPFAPPTKGEFSKSLEGMTAGSRSEINAAVRRPTNGLVLAGDTPASLSIRNATGAPVQLLKNSSTDQDASWFTTNFILQSVQTQRAEKFQEIETFGPTYGFFFGERPIMITASAVLISTPDFPWAVEWWWNYAHGLSGTSLTAANSRVYLEYNDMILEGYILNCQVVENTDVPYSANMSFTMWVTQLDYTHAPGSSTQEEGPGSWDTQYGNMTPETYNYGNETTSTGAMFAKNLEKLLAVNEPLAGRTGIQALRYLEGQTKTFVGTLGGLTSLASVFLFGRDIVLPAGYLGAEIYAGSAEFVPGTLSDSQLARLTAGGFTFSRVRLPPAWTLTDKAKEAQSSRFSDRRVEYPFAPATQNLTYGPATLPVAEQELRNLYSGVGKERLRYGGGQYRTMDSYGFTEESTGANTVSYLEAFAQTTYKKRSLLLKAFPTFSNETGGQIPEWARVLGRVTYGAALLGTSVGMSELRKSQNDAASENSGGANTVNQSRQ